VVVFDDRNFSEVLEGVLLLHQKPADAYLVVSIDYGGFVVLHQDGCGYWLGSDCCQIVCGWGQIIT